MVRHIVMFQFLEEADGKTKAENLRIAAGMLSGLQEVVPTLLASEVHLGAAAGCPSNYDLALIADFADGEALGAYLVHPAHLSVGDFLRRVRRDRACIDYEV